MNHFRYSSAISLVSLVVGVACNDNTSSHRLGGSDATGGSATSSGNSGGAAESSASQAGAAQSGASAGSNDTGGISSIGSMKGGAGGGGSTTVSVICGDGRLAAGEQCDDGNTLPGDGCAGCRLEAGWSCRVPGKACIPLCGDGQLIGAETCDDSNLAGSDGCSVACQVEPGWSCAGTPSTCTSSVCGNGVVEVGETCDSGANNGLFYGDGSGCSKTCTKEPTCRDGGATSACSNACGDGNRDLAEQCDDGNQINGDGCSALCAVEPGFNCNDVEIEDTQPCSGIPSQKCLIVPVTYRDFDGQQVSVGHPDFFYLGAPSPDGRTTGVTPGATQTTCVPNASGTATKWTAGQACTNSDATGACTGLVQSTLGADGKPVFARGTCPCVFTDRDRTGLLGTCPPSGTGACTPSANLSGVDDCALEVDGSHRLRVESSVAVIQSKESFAQWYSDSTFSAKTRGAFELLATTAGQYQFTSSRLGIGASAVGRTVFDDLHEICLSANRTGTLSSGFFPLEDSSRGKLCNIWPYWTPGLSSNCCAGEGCPVPSQWDPMAAYDNCPASGTGGPVPNSSGAGGKVIGAMRNFYFTTEVRYLYRYDGTPRALSFYGDDDVWVFVNGRLALDLGATHERVQGSVAIGPSFGLVAGRMYEIAVFHAERHPRESNYQLTLPASRSVRSSCNSLCGDGVVTTGEECDQGSANQDGLYGGCGNQCKIGPFCGDGVVNGSEACDDGLNVAMSEADGRCGPGCKLPTK